MKYWIIKIFWFFANPLKRIYWFVVRPTVRGVKAIIVNNNKFLLVKLNYAHRMWTFPGGKVNNKETFIEAAQREVLEETGIKILNPVFIGSYESNKYYKNDTVEVYYGASDAIETKIDPIEIKEVDWFDRDNIPQDRNISVDKVLKFYDEFKSTNTNKI